MSKLKAVNKDQFYRQVYRQESNATQIGFTTVRFTNAIGKLIGLVIFHESGNTYLIK